LQLQQIQIVAGYFSKVFAAARSHRSSHFFEMFHHPVADSRQFLNFSGVFTSCSIDSGRESH